MRLLMMMYSVDHLEASVDFYRQLGMVPIWWPNDEAVVLSTGVDSAAMIMLTRDTNETLLGPGGVFSVEDVDSLRRCHHTLDWLIEPVDCSIGRYAAFADRTGVPIRLVDYSRDAIAREFFENQKTTMR
jgi:catechol 2,3-dioxygenase-like lactoylglutathione lyase family enzyme